MKIMGVILIVVCGLLMGVSKHRSLKRRVDMLEDLEAFLHSVQLRIEFSLDDLPGILSSDNHAFSGRITELLQKGEFLPSAWNLAAAEFSDAEDRKFAAGIFDDFGKADPEEEKLKLERNRMFCRELILSAKENLSTKGRTEALMPIYLSVITALILL